MTEVAYDISVIEDALIALTEGASDEKYIAIFRLEKLLLAKKDALNEFEMQEEVA